jgi:hypothetical protein
MTQPRKRTSTSVSSEEIPGVRTTTLEEAEPTKFAGVYTTEFWLSVLIVLCATVLLALDKVGADQWMIVAGANGVGYSLARGLSKVNPPKGVA